MSERKGLVYVKPIVKERWHGLNKVGRTKFPNTNDVIQAAYSRSLGHLSIELSLEDQERLAKALGVESLAPLSSNEFWQEFKVKMEDTTMVFDMSKPRDELAIAVLKGSKYIANSQKDLNAWPHAKYIIHDEVEEQEAKAAVVSQKAKATEVFNKLSPEKKRKLLKLYGLGAGDVTENFVYTELFQKMEDNPVEFLKHAQRTPEEIDARALLFDLEKFGIVRRKGLAYLYNDEQVGFDYEDTIQNLVNPANQELFIKLKERLELKGYNFVGKKKPKTRKKKETAE